LGLSNWRRNKFNTAPAYVSPQAAQQQQPQQQAYYGAPSEPQQQPVYAPPQRMVVRLRPHRAPVPAPMNTALSRRDSTRCGQLRESRRRYFAPAPADTAAPAYVPRESNAFGGRLRRAGRSDDLTRYDASVCTTE